MVFFLAKKKEPVSFIIKKKIAWQRLGWQLNFKFDWFNLDSDVANMSKCALKWSLRGLTECQIMLCFLFFSLTVQCHSGQKKKVFITTATERGSEVEGETEAERAGSEQPSVWWGVICLPSNSMKILKLASSFFFFLLLPSSPALPGI